ncbi:MAG: hypothetical protein D6725_00165 [Planctomycetota bacterium]|nr:MAG: hypothetical protein D6725_00165 [Planctomycetota bacterium]
MGKDGFLQRLFGGSSRGEGRASWRMVSKPFGELPRSDSEVTRDVFRFTVHFVERAPLDVTEAEALWSAADMIGTVAAERRAALQRVGMAVGHSGRQLPPELDRLLHPSPGIGLLANCRSQRITVLEGGESELQTGPMLKTAELILPGDPEPRHFEAVRFVVRLRAKRLEEDWVRVTLLPEIHHGPVVQRHVPDTHGNWRITTSQSVVPLYALGVQTDLTPSDHLILGRHPNRTDGLGKWFFSAFTEDGLVTAERLVILRLDGVGVLRPAYRE